MTIITSVLQTFFFFLCITIIQAQSTSHSAHPKVVGGYNADPTRYPYYTLVRIQSTNGATFSCGGTLIWEDVVVTAAHCKIAGGKVTEVFVNRTTAITLGEETGFEHRRAVAKWKIHPNFDDRFLNYENDVMVVKLESPVTSVKPAQINFDPSLLPSISRFEEPLTLVGLGQTESNSAGSLPLQLQVATVYKNEFEKCQTSYDGFLIEEQQFCASGLNGQDACRGDSGGPLLIEGEEDDLLVGLVSFGEDCGDPAYPGVYARMSTYYDWLQQRICTLSENPPASCTGNGDGDDTLEAPPATLSPLEQAVINLTEAPTAAPTEAPTEPPTEAPTEAPITPTAATEAPMEAPTEEPTEAPTEAPTEEPTEAPMEAPTEEPTEAPTEEPTEAPITSTAAPITPTAAPIVLTTSAPTVAPTWTPTEVPTEAPTKTPTMVPTGAPIVLEAPFAPIAPVAPIMIAPLVPESLRCEDCWCVPEQESSDECPSEIEHQASFGQDLIETYNSWVLTSSISLEPTDCEPFSEDNACELPNRNTPANADAVCAFVFDEDGILNEACVGRRYEPKTFANLNAIPENAVLTHYGACGVCSSAQDLTTRMATVDNFWEETVPSCRLAENKVACFTELGFTTDCASLWAASVEAESTLCANACAGDDSFFLSNTSCASADSCRQCWVDEIETKVNELAGRTMASSGIIELDFKRSCSEYKNAIIHNPCPPDDIDRGNSTSGELVPGGGGGFALCFSPETTVNVLNQGDVPMKDLNVGDMVLTSNNKYEPVYTFGHYSSTGKADYLQFLPSGLELSADHLLYVESKGFITASQVQIGDALSDGKVADIRHVTRTGMYAPFTPSGKIVVNRMLSSCYVSLQSHTEVLKIGSISLPITHHFLAHAFTLPLRLWFGYIQTNNPGKEGVSSWAEVSVKAFHWIFQQAMPLQWLVMIPIVSLLFCFAILDHFPILSMIIVVSLIILCRRYYFVNCNK